MSARDHLVAQGDYAEGWKPEPGDEVEGRVTAIDTRDAGRGPYRIFTVADALSGAELAVHASSAVLRSDTVDVVVGDELYVRFNGQKRSRAGNDYASYTVGIEKATQAASAPAGADDI